MQHIIELLIVLLGIGVTPLLYYRFPKIPKHIEPPDDKKRRSLSVIIPARNEEKNLPLLLEDLKEQRYGNFEIIVVDDGSKDKTAEISKSFGVKVITICDKPSGWLGKTWACQKGAEASEGELLLFLDADVRLKPQAVERILKTYEKKGIPLSVQPYHKTEKCYEQASLFFNLIQIGANGVSLKKPQNIGLYGPLIFISKDDYKTIGGHESVKENIVEDMALGVKLKEAKIPYDLYVGDEEISFRMYSGGFQSLLEGWTKNIASGAMRIPLLLFVMIFFFLSSLISVPLHIVTFSLGEQGPWLFVYSVFYVLWVGILYDLSRHVGKFHPLAVLFYPLPLLVLVLIFFTSLYKKIFKKKVVWKGRSI